VIDVYVSPRRDTAVRRATVALCEARVGEVLGPGWSDQQGQLVEGSQDPEVCYFLGPEFVVSAADVLHECVPGADHACAAELFQAAHRPQSGLQAAVIGFDGLFAYFCMPWHVAGSSSSSARG